MGNYYKLYEGLKRIWHFYFWPRMITVETYIPVQRLAPKQFNLPSNNFANIDSHKADWPDMLLALESIDWGNQFHHLLVFIILLTFYIINVCIRFQEKITVKTKSLNSIERERSWWVNVQSFVNQILLNLMLNWLKLNKLSVIDTSKRNSMMSLLLWLKSNFIIIFFFRYAIKNSICRSDIGPLLNPRTQLLVNERF